MKRMISLLVVLALTFSANTFAQDKKKSKKTSKSDSKANDITTNKKLKAELGSMSKFSMSGSIGYTGASIKAPFGDERPNPNGLPGNYATYFSGSVSARYRLDKFRSITAGVSFLKYLPSTYTYSIGGVTTPRPTKDEISNPSISYNEVLKGDGYVQTKSYSITKYTKESTLDTGWSWDLSYSTAFYWSNVKGTNFTLGFSFSAYHELFNREIYDDYKGQFSTGVDDYGFGIYPFAEYQLTDRVSLRTVVGQAWYHDVGNANWNNFKRLKLYQTFGVGIAITDLIYMYNYVKFYPVLNINKNTEADSFNNTAYWAVSVTFNLF
jgi:hypothetical protein